MIALLKLPGSRLLRGNNLFSFSLLSQLIKNRADEELLPGHLIQELHKRFAAKIWYEKFLQKYKI